MKNRLINALIISGTAVILVALSVGGWILLDRFLSSSYGPSGTRNLYQEATRAVTMEQPIAYVGSDKCMTCHLKTRQEWLHSSHSTVACEDCHGPGSQHIEHAAPMYLSTSSSLCLTCHAKLSVRPESFPQVVADEHNGGVACLECHNPMHPDISKPPEMPDVFTDTSNYLECHSVGNFPSIPEDHELRTVDSCTQCHIMQEEQK